MMKKLAVPALMLAMAAFGCSSSTTTTTGTGGSGGHSTGGSAVAGHAGGGNSGGGTSGGGTSGGGTSGGGTSGGGRAGGGTSGGGTSGGGTSGGGTSGGGTSGGGHAGGGTSGGGTSGGGAGGGIQALASCTVTAQDHTSVLTAAAFCANLLANCPAATGYTDEATCEASYMAAGASVDKRNCQSYHLCWGVEGQGPSGGGIPATHCPHAQAMAVCTTANYP
ncbi:MAG: hypothetical protein ACJ8F1_13735 [Polyangia bacterium]